MIDRKTVYPTENGLLLKLTLSMKKTKISMFFLRNWKTGKDVAKQGLQEDPKVPVQLVHF